ncbi:hypothetical protein D3C71_1828940 [compost metagenome]
MRGRFGHQQKNQQAHGQFVWRIEPDGVQQLEHSSHRCLEALDAPVGNGHAMAQTGGAQAFTRKEAVGDQRARETVLALEQQTRFFKSTLLAGGVNAHKHLSGGQDGGESVHGQG